MAVVLFYLEECALFILGLFWQLFKCGNIVDVCVHT